MFWELFLVGSFWFWAIIIVEAFWLIRCLCVESGPGIGGSLTFLAVVLWLFGDFNIFSWIWYNPVLLLECAAGYAVLGVIWSVVRFKLLCTDARDMLEDVKQEFKDQHEITGEIPADMRIEWREFAGNINWPGSGKFGVIQALEDIIPKARNNKATIMYWMGYWPLSMLWFFFHDMIERIVQRVYRYFVRLYDSIARNTFAGVHDDFGGDDKQCK